MTHKERLMIANNRLVKLMNNPKDIKCPGVVRKLKRQIRALGSNVD